MSDVPSSPSSPDGQRPTPPPGVPPYTGPTGSTPGGPPPGPYGGPHGGSYNPQPMRPDDEKLWATLIHIGGIPFGFLPALIGYFVLRDRGPFIKDHTRVALNFQLTMLIGYVIGGLLWIVVIGFFVTAAVGIVIIIFSILAAIAAQHGQFYKYPLTIEFFKE